MKGLLLITLLALTACQKNSTAVNSDTQKAPGIMGGEVVQSSDEISKSIVMIYNIMPDGNVSSCTGTILSANLILTAAHCTAKDPSQLYVAFGTNAPSLLSGEFDKKMLRRVVGGRVTETWPKLDPRFPGNWGDVAILRINGKIPEGYKPVKFIEKNMKLENGMKVVLAGYGTVDDAGEAAKSLNKVEVTLRDSTYSETEVVMEQKNKQGACHGDSGGPAFVFVNGQARQFGVASRTTLKTGSCIDGLIYTNALKWSEFVVKSAEELQKITKVEPIPQPGFLD